MSTGLSLKSIAESQIKIAYEQEEKEFEKNSFLRNKEIMPISYPTEPQPKEISNTTPVETIEPVKEPFETNELI